MFFTTEEKSSFKENGYVVKNDVIPSDLRERAIDVLWDVIEADRNDPQTWIDAGPRGNLSCSDHPDIEATVHQTPVFEMAEELAGKGRLGPRRGGPLCKMVYPTGHENWEPPQGHLDGYIVDGVGGTFTIGVTMNIVDIEPNGGGFTCWKGSHEKLAEYFRSHSLLNGWHINRREVAHLAGLDDRYEHAAPAGSVVFWHHYMLHSASMNCRRDIRMAFVTRFSFKNLNDIMFDLPYDLWGPWEGLNDVA